MAVGVLPGWRPFVRLIPWYRRGSADVKTLACIPIMAVMKSLRFPNGPRRSAKQAPGWLGHQCESYGPRGASIVDCKVGHDLSSAFSPPVLTRLEFILPPPAPSYTASHTTRTSRVSCKRTSMNTSALRIAPSQLRTR
jgi:hypothetical protein